jgi:ribosomal protein L11 methylase PrmA
MSDTNIEFSGKSLLDIGCGHGILGIAGLKSGASVCYFQDFNKYVLENVTMNNVILNDLNTDLCKFVFGDWD